MVLCLAIPPRRSIAVAPLQDRRGQTSHRDPLTIFAFSGVATKNGDGSMAARCTPDPTGHGPPVYSASLSHRYRPPDRHQCDRGKSTTTVAESFPCHDEPPRQYRAGRALPKTVVLSMSSTVVPPNGKPSSAIDKPKQKCPDLDPLAVTSAKSLAEDGGSNNPLFSALQSPSSSSTSPTTLSRYENQKRRDWNTFGQYLRNHRPPLSLARCSGAHVLKFLRYLDQFGKTKVHAHPCPFFGHPSPPAPCPLRQAWGSLDALIGHLRAAFEENGGKPESNPFGARAVRLYLREIRDS
ncbi:hypothetical protein RJ639_021074 [Escallonia herrerae]|uniref:ALOG domain-containing protein n=1 Tax=Escallonia herrerae TaxID=1293975 RepID=A0AA89AH47_9ASTE|nr:hypothetical protein RJ639_021074 [Escallonia herrerae]